MAHNKSGYFVIFDEIPEITYIKNGLDYIGTAQD